MCKTFDRWQPRAGMGYHRVRASPHQDTFALREYRSHRIVFGAAAASPYVSVAAGDVGRWSAA